MRTKTRKKKDWTRFLEIFMLLLVVLVFEGVLISQCSSWLFTAQYALVSHLLLFVVILIGLNSDYANLPWLIFFIGFLYDAYFLGILGLYVWLLPLMMFLTQRIRGYLPVNPVTVMLIFLLAICFIDTVLYGYYTMLDITKLSLDQFLLHRLLPTLVLNAVFLLGSYYGLNQIIKKILN